MCGFGEPKLEKEKGMHFLLYTKDARGNQLSANVLEMPIYVLFLSQTRHKPLGYIMLT